MNHASQINLPFRRIKPFGNPLMRMSLLACGGLRMRDACGWEASAVLGRVGSLELRMARCAADVRRAQRLRFKVFYQEMSAVPDAAALLAGRDIDPFDAVCDHLLVMDKGRGTNRNADPSIVGTYRLLRQDVAQRKEGFYSESEFDVSAVTARHSSLRFLELGRSCVLPAYRHKRTIELLWHGIWSYVLHHRVDVMIGCASLEGIDPDRLALPLSFLHHFARAPEQWRTGAVASRYVDLNRMQKADIDVRSALRELPPLIKGYLRLGAFVADGAVVDHRFGTTDVFVVLPVAAINRRYIDHFGAGAERHAA